MSAHRPARHARRGESVRRERVVLLTGFEPFGGESRNPSAEIVQHLHGRILLGRRMEGRVLPCVFGEATRQLRAHVRRLRPEFVICLGFAASRKAITPERVALNLEDARIPDNAGAQPIDRPIMKGGPAALWSTLPVKAIVAALQEAGLPATVSQTAGTFVCNHVFYGLMHLLRRRRDVRGGFIHLPPTTLPDQAGAGLPWAHLVQGMERAIEVALTQRRDVRRPHRATE